MPPGPARCATGVLDAVRARVGAGPASPRSRPGTCRRRCRSARAAARAEPEPARTPRRSPSPGLGRSPGSAASGWSPDCCEVSIQAITASVSEQGDRSERASHGALIGTEGGSSSGSARPRRRAPSRRALQAGSGGTAVRVAATRAPSALARSARTASRQRARSRRRAPAQVLGRAKAVLVVERRVDEAPGAVGVAQEVVARERAVEVRVVVLQVDPAAERAGGAQQAEALAEVSARSAPGMCSQVSVLETNSIDSAGDRCRARRRARGNGSRSGPPAPPAGRSARRAAAARDPRRPRARHGAARTRRGSRSRARPARSGGCRRAPACRRRATRRRPGSPGPSRRRTRRRSPPSPARRAMLFVGAEMLQRTRELLAERPSPAGSERRTRRWKT